MNIQETFKDISRLPEYVQNIWADVRDLSISASNANSRNRQSHKEIIDKIDLLNKSYIELFRICCSRFNSIDDTLETIKSKIIVLSNNMSEENEQNQIKNILREHFDNMSFDLRDHDIVCTSEDAINIVQSDVEELTSQVQDIVNTMNNGFNELKSAIEERNWTIQPGKTLTITAAVEKE